MDESSGQVGRLCKSVNVTMSVLLIISHQISDHLDPGPEPESSLLSRLWLRTLYRFRAESSHSEGLDYSAPVNKYWVSHYNVSDSVQRTMIPSLEIPHQPAQRRRSLPRLPDLPCPDQPSLRLQSNARGKGKIMHMDREVFCIMCSL